MENNQTSPTYENAMRKIKDSLDGGWEHCADSTLAFIEKMTTNYSEKLGMDKGDILTAIESKRDYSSPNYYQAANFPTLDDNVTIYPTLKEAMLDICPSLGFRCPACGGISKDPYKCNSGIVSGDNKKICDWKSYGFFGTLGKGFRFTIKESFLDNPKIDEIFMPMSKVAKIDKKSEEEKI